MQQNSSQLSKLQIVYVIAKDYISFVIISYTMYTKYLHTNTENIILNDDISIYYLPDRISLL